MNSTQMASNVASVANTSTSSVQPVMVQSQPAQNTSTSSGNVLIKVTLHKQEKKLFFNTTSLFIS